MGLPGVTQGCALVAAPDPPSLDALWFLNVKHPHWAGVGGMGFWLSSGSCCPGWVMRVLKRGLVLRFRASCRSQPLIQLCVWWSCPALGINMHLCMCVSSDTARNWQHVALNLVLYVLLLVIHWFSETALSVKHYSPSCFERQALGLVMNSTLTAVAIAVHCIIRQSIPARYIDVFSADTWL